MTGPLHVCKNCGLVYVRERRTSEEIAAAWTGLYHSAYNGLRTYVKVQHAWLAGVISDSLDGLEGSAVLDVGGGQGHLARLLSDTYGANATCLDPSPDNAKTSVAEKHLLGRLEDVPSAAQFDIVVMNYTLECGADPAVMMRKCWEIITPGGALFVQTGARVLVPPYKLGLGMYLSHNAPDTHPLRFSSTTLFAMFMKYGFEVRMNQVFGTELLTVGGVKSEPKETYPSDNWEAVIGFFNDWHEQSVNG